MLWSARYPCQITVSDSPSGLTPPRCAGSLARRGGRACAQQVSTPSSSSFTRFFHFPANDRRRCFLLAIPEGSRAHLGFNAAEILRRHCGLERYPCQVSVSGSPPALSLAGAADSTFCVGILLGSMVSRTGRLGHSSQPKPCGVTLVCTLPLPTFERQTVRFSRFPGRRRARLVGVYQPRLEAGPIPHRHFLVQLARGHLAVC